MKWLILGALLALLLVFPNLAGGVAAAVLFLLSKPLLPAFTAGLVVGRLRRSRGWLR
ncbi:hypothetical protein [Streptomyces sp. NPDC059786]|uniref:hypothetical protein n=1 Tax=Streptomyces sp. NPDC059786 TaxID=3346946 RepID=UPI0036476C38